MGRGAALAAVIFATALAHALMDTGSAATSGRLFLPSPERARAFSLGFEPVLSDWYWIQAIQVVGSRTRGWDEAGGPVGDLVELVSDRGVIEAVVHTYPGSLPGIVHVSLGLGHEFGTEGVVGSNPMLALVSVRDSISGAASENSTRVSVQVVERRSHGVPSAAHGGGAP